MFGAFVILPIYLKMLKNAGKSRHFALPSLSKVRRMGGAHPHARNYKRWATHKASMRASCGSIEKGLYPLTIYKYNWLLCWGSSPQTLANFCVQKFDKKLGFVLTGGFVYNE